MKMRDYVDGIQGHGSWDRMHDLIDRMEILGWKMPAIMVDNHEVHIFPGTDREVTLEAVQNEVRKNLVNIAAREADGFPSSKH